MCVCVCVCERERESRERREGGESGERGTLTFLGDVSFLGVFSGVASGLKMILLLLVGKENSLGR